MAKKDDKKGAKSAPQIISYADSHEMMREARLAGRNDLIDPKGKSIEIEGPYGRRRENPVNEAEGPRGDDVNTASPGA
jgi:hypothetical protein